MAAVREVDEGHVHVESFVLSVDAEDQQLLAPLGQGFSAALAGARPTAAAVAPATAARRDTTMGMRNALAAARTARRTATHAQQAKAAQTLVSLLPLLALQVHSRYRCKAQFWR